MKSWIKALCWWALVVVMVVWLYRSEQRVDPRALPSHLNVAACDGCTVVTLAPSKYGEGGWVGDEDILQDETEHYWVRSDAQTNSAIGSFFIYRYASGATLYGVRMIHSTITGPYREDPVINHISRVGIPQGYLPVEKMTTLTIAD